MKPAHPGDIVAVDRRKFFRFEFVCGILFGAGLGSVATLFVIWLNS